MKKLFVLLMPSFLSVILIALTTMGCGQNESSKLIETGGVSDESNNMSEDGAVSEIIRLAESGDMEMQTVLGFMYYEGEGVPRDYVESAKWSRKAANQGHAVANFALGCLYYEGVGVTQDYNEAFYYLRVSADKGYPQAEGMLGLLYMQGHGVKTNYQKAFELLKKAAQKGSANAYVGLGAMYYRGLGVTNDLVKAYAWCSVAAANGSANGTDMRDEIEKLMTPAQISEAQTISQQYFNDIASVHGSNEVEQVVSATPQDKVQTPVANKQAVSKDTPKSNLNKQKEIMTDAWNSGDYEVFADYIFPPMAEKLGGKKAIVAQSKMLIDQMKELNVEFSNQKMGEPSEIVDEEYGLAAFVPSSMTIKMDGENFATKGFMVAVSTNNGGQWFFINGDVLPESVIEKMFPALCDEVAIPEVVNELENEVKRLLK